MIPVLGIAGWSGSGKTALLEKLIPWLEARGVRAAVIKHAPHGVSPDAAGKDSERLTKAGAIACALCGPDGPDLNAAVRQIETAGGADIVFAEGFKKADIPKIGIFMEDAFREPPFVPKRLIAAVTDKPMEGIRVPCFGPEEIDRIGECIMQNQNDFTHFDEEGRARMVNVGDKFPTRRTARASGP